MVMYVHLIPLVLPKCIAAEASGTKLNNKPLTLCHFSFQADLQRVGLPEECTAVISMSGENILNPLKRLVI